MIVCDLCGIDDEVLHCQRGCGGTQCNFVMCADCIKNCPDISKEHDFK